MNVDMIHAITIITLAVTNIHLGCLVYKLDNRVLHLKTKDDPNYWIGDYTPYRCPNPYCNKYSDNATKYCPHCGWRIKPKG